MTAETSQAHKVRGGLNPRFVINTLKTGDIKKRMREPIKNGLDHGATCIWIDTTDKKILVIRDNGDGMLEANRVAYVKLGESTSEGDQTKSGNFGSGKAHFAVPLCHTMEVVTAPEDEQDRIYRIVFDMDTYIPRLLAEEDFLWEPEAKTSENWPYEHETGTVITYHIREDRMKTLPRGAKLSKSLSTVLSKYVADRVRVDGKKLPKKDVIGRVLRDSVAKPIIGNVTFEVYRPKRRVAEERLGLGSHLVAEVDFRTLVDMMPIEMQDQIPDVFLLKDVCGTISCTLFEKHISDRRENFDEAILVDPGLPLFISAMQMIADKVREYLDIKEAKRVKSQEDAAIGKKLAEHLLKRYGGEPGGPGEGPGTNDEEEGNTNQGGGGGGQNPLYINLSMAHGHRLREVELGEQIIATAVIREDVRTSGKKQSDLEWDLSGATGATLQKDGTVLILPTEVGKARVEVAFKKSIISAGADFLVVEERKPRLSPPVVTMKVGTTQKVRILNPDKVVGDLDWSSDGKIGLKVDKSKKSATIEATRRGIGTVFVSDNGHMSGQSQCSVTVQDQDDVYKTFRILDYQFRLKVRGLPSVEAVRVHIAKGEGKVGEITLNSASAAYKLFKAKKDEEIMMIFLLDKIADAFTIKRLLMKDKRPDDDISPLDLDDFLAEHVVHPSYDLLVDLHGTSKR